MTSARSSSVARSATAQFTVVVYSDDAAVRERIKLAIGRRPAPELGRVRYQDAATYAEILRFVDAGGIDLLLLDGEAQPTGGIGLSQQVKNEFAAPPLTCVVLARRADRWLASWARADATLAHPLDPVECAEVVADLLRRRCDRAPSIR
jgi:DNA-binding response OmpR family regulator